MTCSACAKPRVLFKKADSKKGFKYTAAEQVRR